MWNKEKSVKLTHLLVRLFYVILTAVAAVSVIVPITVKDYGVFAFYIIPFYISVPAGYIALVCLDRLLINIKKGIVFAHQNVKHLRVFSWLCFFVCVVTILFAIVVFIRMCLDTAGVVEIKNLTIFDLYYLVFTFCVSVAELFVGVVVRVVKNIFEAAIKIKEENELTI